MSTTPTLRTISDMEGPLVVIRDLFHGLIYMGEAMGDPDLAGAVQQIANLGLKEVNRAEDLRGELFNLEHPNRAKGGDRNG